MRTSNGVNISSISIKWAFDFTEWKLDFTKCNYKVIYIQMALYKKWSIENFIVFGFRFLECCSLSALFQDVSSDSKVREFQITFHVLFSHSQLNNGSLFFCLSILKVLYSENFPIKISPTNVILKAKQDENLILDTIYLQKLNFKFKPL